MEMYQQQVSQLLLKKTNNESSTSHSIYLNSVMSSKVISSKSATYNIAASSLFELASTSQVLQQIFFNDQPLCII